MIGTNPLQGLLQQVMQQQAQAQGIQAESPVFQLATDTTSLEQQINAQTSLRTANIYSDTEIRQQADKTLANAKKLEGQARVLGGEAEAAAKTVRTGAEQQRAAEKTLFEQEQERIQLSGKQSLDAVQRSAYALQEFEQNVNSAEAQARREQVNRMYQADLERYNKALQQRNSGGILNWFAGTLKAEYAQATLRMTQNNLNFEHGLVAQSLQTLQNQLAANATLAQHKFAPDMIQAETASALAKTASDYYSKGRAITSEEFATQAQLLNVSKEVVQAGWTQMETMMKSNNASASAFQAVYQSMLTQQMGLNLKQAFEEAKRSDEMKQFHNEHYKTFAEREGITDGRSYEQLLYEWERTKTVPPELQRYVSFSGTVVAREQSAVFRLYDSLNNTSVPLTAEDQKVYSVMEKIVGRENEAITQSYLDAVGRKDVSQLTPDQQKALSEKLLSLDPGKADLPKLQQEYNKVLEAQSRDIKVAMQNNLYAAADISQLALDHPMMQSALRSVPADTRQWLQEGGHKTLVTKLDQNDPAGTVVGNLQGVLSQVFTAQGANASPAEIKRAVRPAIETMAAFYRANRENLAYANPFLLDTKIQVPQSKLGSRATSLAPLEISLENTGDLEVLVDRLMIIEQAKARNIEKRSQMPSSGLRMF